MLTEDKSVSSHAFNIRSSIAKSRLLAEFAGYLDMETVSQLRAFLDGLSDDLAAGIVREFEFDMAQLYLMSSSAISCLASWVKHLSDHFPASHVVFRTNRNFAWQQRALAPIRRLAEHMVTIS